MHILIDKLCSYLKVQTVSIGLVTSFLDDRYYCAASESRMKPLCVFTEVLQSACLCF